MKNRIKLKNVKPLVLVLIFMITFLQSCEKAEELPFQSTDPYLHIDEFGDYLEGNLGSKCVGMQYSIVQKGQLKLNKAIGKSRLAVDGGSIDYNNLQRKSIHSCSKTITAATLVYMLDLYGVSIDAEISTFLPNRWEKEQVEATGITFKQLLQHKSGLRGTLDSYQEMKDYIEAGVFESKNEKYSNINFTLMRILIPNISTLEHSILETIYGDDGENVYAEEVADRYIYYVTNKILIPAGINADVTPRIWDQSEFPIPVYHYSFSNQSNPGYIHTDQTLLTGAGGWYMNAKELASFITYLSSNNIQNIDYKWMSDNELGMYRVNRSGVDYITHNGASAGRADGTGGRAIWVHIPESDVIVTMQINSATNNFTMAELVQTIIDGYLAAIHE